MADRAIGRSDAIEQAAMTRVAEIYAAALRKALKDQKAFLQKIADVDSGKIKPPKYYVDRGLVDRWRQGFTRELIRRHKIIDEIVLELNAAGVDAAEIIRGEQVDIYRVNREWAADRISKQAEKRTGIRVNFATQSRAEVAVLLREEESPFSRLAYKNLGKNPAIRRRLQNELAQASILGESQKKIIKRIRKVTGQTVAQARRVAQTERTRVQSQARWQAGQEAAAMGIGIYNEWRTRMINSREAHIERNGMRAMQGEPFPGSVMKYPGDPAGGAKEVINCHCYLRPGVLLPDERLDADGNIVKVKRGKGGA